MKNLFMGAAVLGLIATYLPTETNQMDVQSAVCMVIAAVNAYLAGTHK